MRFLKWIYEVASTADWRDNTAKVYVGILLDWAQHTNFTPHLFISNQLAATIFCEDIPTTLWS